MSKFTVYFSDGKTADFLFAHAAKEFARKEVEEGRQKWAKVISYEGLVILRVGNPPG